MPTYLPYQPEQAELLPAHVIDVLGRNHLCFLIHRLVEDSDLSEFDQAYGDEGGQRPYAPQMMVKVWLYGFAVKVRTTRKLEQRLREDLGFRFLGGGCEPDHKTLSEFLRRHRGAIDGLFTQILLAMREAGMAQIGRVAIDSTRVKANASPDKIERQVRQQVRHWREGMEEETPDQEPGTQVDPGQGEVVQQRLRQRRAHAGDTVKRSTTDPEARFLKERGRFVLGYTGDIAVSADHFIVGQRVSQTAHDYASLVPMVEDVEQRCRQRPSQVLADSGFCTIANIQVLEQRDIDVYVPDTTLAHEINTGRPALSKVGRMALSSPDLHRMRKKLRSPAGRELYQHRKSMVEPVFGILKEQRGMRQFYRRGLAGVSIEWALAALAYNITRMYTRSQTG
jgi:transposase